MVSQYWLHSPSGSQVLGLVRFRFLRCRTVLTETHRKRKVEYVLFLFINGFDQTKSLKDGRFLQIWCNMCEKQTELRCDCFWPRVRFTIDYKWFNWGGLIFCQEYGFPEFRSRIFMNCLLIQEASFCGDGRYKWWNFLRLFVELLSKQPRYYSRSYILIYWISHLMYTPTPPSLLPSRSVLSKTYPRILTCEVWVMFLTRVSVTPKIFMLFDMTQSAKQSFFPHLRPQITFK